MITLPKVRHRTTKEATISLSLDDVPILTPNPPPWQINFLNNNTDNYPSREIPEAFTVGLRRFSVPELQIRLASPALASSILDRLGIWLVYQQASLKPRMKMNINGIDVVLVPIVDSAGNQAYRLAWGKDPVNN
jgi:hypothetical protein